MIYQKFICSFKKIICKKRLGWCDFFNFCYISPLKWQSYEQAWNLHEEGHKINLDFVDAFWRKVNYLQHFGMASGHIFWGLGHYLFSPKNNWQLLLTIFGRPHVRWLALVIILMKPFVKWSAFFWSPSMIHCAAGGSHNLWQNAVTRPGKETRFIELFMQENCVS